MSEITWLSHSKRRIPVRDMVTPHLRNAIKMMEREVPQHYLDEDRNAVPVYHAMKAELLRRESFATVSTGIGAPIMTAKIPTREQIDEQRAAFLAGAKLQTTRLGYRSENQTGRLQLARDAAARYPYPTSTVPRVVSRDNPKGLSGPYTMEYRVTDVTGNLESRIIRQRTGGRDNTVSEWSRCTLLNQSMLEDLLSLYKTPTVQVETI